MKRKLILATLCTAAIGMSLLLSGCTHGIGDTITLVKKAEAAKQAVEQVANMEDGTQVSVGTAANPNYTPVNRLNVAVFDIALSGTEFTAKWTVDTNFSFLSSVMIYAATDMSGEGGVKIGSFSNVPIATERTFELTQPLEEGTYYCYIKVVGQDNNPVTMYCATPIQYTEQDPEGSLADIVITADDEFVYISWTAMPDQEQYYRAILVSAENTDTILAETKVVGTQAKFEIPEGATELYIAAASYLNGEMGPYRLHHVDLEELAADAPDATVPDSPAADVPETSGSENSNTGTGESGK